MGSSSKQLIMFTSDELVLDVTDLNMDEVRPILSNIIEKYKNSIPLHYEEFTLKRIVPIAGYVKLFDNGSYKIKSTHKMYLPILTRHFNNEPFNELDLYYVKDGKIEKMEMLKNIRMVDEL